MATTPPPSTSCYGRARTPPAPKHGGFHDRYQPYSPTRRRSTRGTANKYSTRSMNAGASEGNRHSRVQTHISSPPSSPIVRSPNTSSPSSCASTQRTRTSHRSGAVFDTDSDDEEVSSARPTKRTNMLPTPSKTPLKKGAKRGKAGFPPTARVLDFQTSPLHPNDAMPTQREVQKQKAHRRSSANGFGILDETAPTPKHKSSDVPIYTDSDARIPEVDTSEDNPFWGPRRPAGTDAAPQRRSRRRSRKSPEELEEEQRIEAAVARGEGMLFSFRGKKVFKPFATTEPEATTSNTPVGGQADLLRQAGAAAQRTLTRSSFGVRRLFPEADHVDEEALTDTEMRDTTTSTAGDSHHLARLETARRTHQEKPQSAPSMSRPAEDEEEQQQQQRVEPAPLAMPESPEIGSAGKAYQIPSPFDSWQRVKSGKKREGEAMEASSTGGGKRAKGAMSTSAARDV